MIFVICSTTAVLAWDMVTGIWFAYQHKQRQPTMAVHTCGGRSGSRLSHQQLVVRSISSSISISSSSSPTTGSQMDVPGIQRQHRTRRWRWRILCQMMIMMMVIRLLPPQPPPGRVMFMLMNAVSAQATGFCHRPAIKPNFVGTDSDVDDADETTANHHRFYNTENVFVIAHRGASYHIPIEHSRASYRLALELSSHFIETDLAISQDGVLFPMHSIDLTMTTDILSSKLVVDREPWFSIYANRSSYWSFNFTFAELLTLTLQQRKSTEASSSSSSSLNNPPTAATTTQPERTNLYDNLFTIPTLEDVVHLLVDWNINEIPKLHSNKTKTRGVDGEPTDPQAASRIPNDSYDIYKAGLYLEFKNTDWIAAETGYDVVDLLFTQITGRLLEPTPTTTTSRRYTWKDLFTCYERIRFDQYIIPPLILQSFNHSDLLLFHSQWHQYQVPNFADPSTTTNQLSTIAPEPLYVVLVDAPQCYDDSFWYTMSNDQYRSFINGIGCHKNCILPLTTASTTGSTGSSNASLASPPSNTLSEQEMVEEQHEHIEAIMERITELQMVLHVWTERPEISYLNQNPMFRTVMDEIYYLKCNVSHVHGIFTESVDMVLHALQIPCPTTTTTGSNAGTTFGAPQQTAICNDNNKNSKTPIAIVFVSFLLGIMVTWLTNRFSRYYLSKYTTNRCSTNSNSYQHATATTNDEDDDDDNIRNGFNDDDHKNNGLELSIT